VRKPKIQHAVEQLVTRLRDELPFHLPPDQLCQHSCSGCPKKLMEYLDTELEDVEYRLTNGDEFSLGEISKLARTGGKIFKVMEKNGLVHLEKQDKPSNPL